MPLNLTNISIDSNLENSDIAKEIKTKFPKIKFVSEPPKNSDFVKGKKHLHFRSKKGKSLSICASLNDSYICCNVHVLNTVSNCPYSCSYCFLQNYLTNTTTQVTSDIESVLNEIEQYISQEPNRLFRIGNWELGDSLALEKVTNQASKLIQGFAKFPNAILDLRTKSDQVDTILKLKHQGKTAVGWTLNPKAIIQTEEKGTASLDKRLLAMKKVADAGYLVCIHLDPIIYYQNWQKDYTELINKIFQFVPASRIGWISMGSFRFNPEMKKKMETNFPSTKLTSTEMILGKDGKVRYVKPIRTKLYKYIYNLIQKQSKNKIFVHLCMERWDMWEKVFGYYPKSIEHLEEMFTNHLLKRLKGFHRPRGM
jgi:spore photoproduct lyase